MKFIKGDYIVLLSEQYIKDDCFPTNFCFKQREDNKQLTTELDCRESDTNGWLVYMADSSREPWRYAIQQEINEYNRLGKPFDVTKLNKEILYEIY